MDKYLIGVIGGWYLMGDLYAVVGHAQMIFNGQRIDRCTLDLDMQCLGHCTVHHVVCRETRNADVFGKQRRVPGLETGQRQLGIGDGIADLHPCGVGCLFLVILVHIAERCPHPDQLAVLLGEIRTDVDGCVGLGVAVVGRIDGVGQGVGFPGVAVVEASLDGQRSFRAHVEAFAVGHLDGMEAEIDIQGRLGDHDVGCLIQCSEQIGSVGVLFGGDGDFHGEQKQAGMFLLVFIIQGRVSL